MFLIATKRVDYGIQRIPNDAVAALYTCFFHIKSATFCAISSSTFGYRIG